MFVLNKLSESESESEDLRRTVGFIQQTGLSV